MNNAHCGRTGFFGLRIWTFGFRNSFGFRNFELSSGVLLLSCFLLGILGSAVRASDQPQWGQAWSRNMVSAEQGLPDAFDSASGKNIKWSARLGTETHSTPVIAGGRVYIGTNNGEPRDPKHQGDRGVLMCFDEKTGRFLWQLVVPKREEDPYHDWPKTGISSANIMVAATHSHTGPLYFDALRTFLHERAVEKNGSDPQETIETFSKEVINKRLAVPFFGPSYSEGEIHAAVKEFGDRVEANTFEKLDETCREAAKLIADGKVIAWFRGRMEFGPRALGHRSILAEPGDPDMRDRINAMVKMREAFRPFAPAVSLEQVSRWFDVPPMTELPYMIMIVNVRKEHRASLPAITHVDGSARVQTVSTADNAEFHTLLREVGKVTGREMVLNTSFNVKGQPIVNTPREALETFLGTGIEYLFLENTLARRLDR